jgi:hypothetical protein
MIFKWHIISYLLGEQAYLEKWERKEGVNIGDGNDDL